VTCPQKTDPTIELGLGSAGGRFNGKKSFFTLIDHHEGKVGIGTNQPR
jgi:hypothetical protein